jgi:hypothetical protein
MTLPTFLIPGAMKAGTSSLAALLRQHPDIYLPEREVHFFNVDARYEKGMGHYETYFEGAAGAQAVGEKTPTYSYQANVPERIARHLPGVKLLWIFREPVSRAYSHYRFFVSMGKERQPFDRVLAREGQGRTTDFTMRYQDRSVYVTQVERYLQYFAREQMAFLLFEDLLHQPQQVLARTCAFLGVDPTFDFPERTVRQNVTRQPRSVLFQWIAYQVFHRKGARVLRLVKKVNRKAAGRPEPMDPGLRHTLSTFYAPHNERLAALTGLDLSVWNKDARRV